MHDLNMLFRERINDSQKEKMTFDHLNTVLEKTSKTIPFENLSIIEGRAEKITKENLINKILDRREGGLCYELNPIMYLFLKENGFHPSLVLGNVYDEEKQQWSATGKTHVANLINYHEEIYLIDVGFGGNVPLRPVPLNGKSVVSSNGEFRIEKENTPYGDYIFYMKLKHKHDDWKIGYTFDSKNPVIRLEELNHIQKIIQEDEESDFNKKVLINILTDQGSMTLTDHSFTKWVNGEEKKCEIDENQFQKIKEMYFSL